MPNGRDRKIKSRKRTVPELARAHYPLSVAFNSSTPCTSCLSLASFRLTLIHARYQTDIFLLFDFLFFLCYVRAVITIIDGSRSARGESVSLPPRAIEDLLGSSGLTLRFQAGMGERSREKWEKTQKIWSRVIQI